MQLCESCEEPIEIQSVVRGHNRLLRRIVRTLRGRLQTNKAYQDALFLELCNSSPAAELAMREIWEKGGFQPPCGPDDYDEIVDTCIRALKAYREVASEPAQSNRAECPIPPEGWYCTRGYGHSGPCAALPK